MFFLKFSLYQFSDCLSFEASLNYLFALLDILGLGLFSGVFWEFGFFFNCILNFQILTTVSMLFNVFHTRYLTWPLYFFNFWFLDVLGTFEDILNCLAVVPSFQPCDNTMVNEDENVIIISELHIYRVHCGIFVLLARLNHNWYWDSKFCWLKK